MSKKIFYFAFVAFAIAGMSTMTTSCKKGENDPGLSLRSRMARVTGEWKLEEGTRTSSNTFGGATVTSTTTYTNSSYTTSNGFTSQYTEKLTIEKDGTYEVVVTDDGDTYTITGVWFFSGKIKDLDLKNKEAIMFTPQTYSEPGYSETYEGLYGGGDVMIIDQLKNKEIIFKGAYSYTGSGSSSSTTYDRTFLKQ